MKKVIIVGLIVLAALEFQVKKDHPVKEPGMTKADLIDAIAAGSKLTKADAG